jgi:hypothetical protein
MMYQAETVEEQLDEFIALCTQAIYMHRLDMQYGFWDTYRWN